ncbi:unnamed protein product [Protopolystoma xenopodis]|uniref:Uncharacterized protein n=1 Tax=Protopolystoma xenopodis TaxID=117903 RepID=A0A448XHG0_9PLAT|nr:unnamed protein product [Protopolystoma xenopodis]
MSLGCQSSLSGGSGSGSGNISTGGMHFIGSQPAEDSPAVARTTSSLLNMGSRKTSLVSVRSSLSQTASLSGGCCTALVNPVGTSGTSVINGGGDVNYGTRSLSSTRLSPAVLGFGINMGSGSLGAGGPNIVGEGGNCCSSDGDVEVWTGAGSPSLATITPNQHLALYQSQELNQKNGTSKVEQQVKWLQMACEMATDEV